MTQQRCDLCKFYVPYGRQGPQGPQDVFGGECRINPPAPPTFLKNRGFPVVQPNDFCGKFETTE